LLLFTSSAGRWSSSPLLLPRCQPPWIISHESCNGGIKKIYCGDIADLVFRRASTFSQPDQNAVHPKVECSSAVLVSGSGILCYHLGRPLRTPFLLRAAPRALSCAVRAGMKSWKFLPSRYSSARLDARRRTTIFNRLHSISMALTSSKLEGTPPSAATLPHQAQGEVMLRRVLCLCSYSSSNPTLIRALRPRAELANCRIRDLNFSPTNKSWVTAT
jgi:hypothetical protein